MGTGEIKNKQRSHVEEIHGTNMIRKFQESMLDSVMSIWYKGNKAAHQFIAGSYWETHYDEVKEQISKAEIYVYIEENEVQAFIGLSNDSYIAGLFVAKEYQRMGIGKMLLDQCKEEKESLSLHVYKKNESAVSFYISQNFEVQDEKQSEETGEIEYLMKWNKG